MFAASWPVAMNMRGQPVCGVRAVVGRPGEEAAGHADLTVVDSSVLVSTPIMRWSTSFVDHCLGDYSLARASAAC